MSRAKGNEAEDRACEFLTSRGFRIVERNFFAKCGEIDIIASKDGILHFVEVKSGTSFEPIYNITPSKIKKLTKAINIYLLERRINSPYCLDALIVKGEDCEMIENITLC